MEIPEISCDEALAMIDAGAIWVDVREEGEWREFRIEGTELLPLQQAARDLPARVTDQTQTIVVSCHSGGRSGQLVNYLRSLGYVDVHNLRGGIVQWVKEGRAIVTG